MRNRLSSVVRILILLVVVGYLFSGVYSLQSGQHAVILRFGKVTESVVDSGIHYHLPYPIERSIKTHVANVQTISILENENENKERFTGDENLIVVKAIVSYDVKDLGSYLFGTNDITKFIRSTGQMCLSQELAKMRVDDAMTAGKSILRLSVKRKMQTILNEMQVGVHIISIELTDITPPRNVSSAFKDVSDARVKKQEIIKDAEGYANSIIPKARGKSASLKSEANAFARETVNSAKARVSSFNNLLVEYRKNPHIIKKQKYLETIQTIYSNANVSVDSNPGQSIYYINQEQTKTSGVGLSRIN